MKEFLREQGISFPLGGGRETFGVKLRIGGSKGVQDVLRLDGTSSDIYAEMGRIVEDHPTLTNGPLLGFENWRVGPDEVGGKELTVDASVLRYVTYMACHRLRAQGRFFDGEDYVALSVCGVVYDETMDVFYLKRRPEDSQEDPGGIDAPGGVLDPRAFHPEVLVEETARDRFVKKLGIQVQSLDCLGLMRIFDQTYSLYNFAILGRIRTANEPDLRYNFSDLEAIPRTSAVNNVYNNMWLTAPAKAMLYMAMQVL